MVISLVAAGGVGAVIGVAARGSAADRQGRELHGQLATSTAAAQALQADLTEANASIDTLGGEVSDAQADAEDAQASAEAKAQQDYASKLADVKRREDAVTVRENAVASAEAKQQGNTFAGDGTYLVNKEVQPGTYRTDGPNGDTGDCYYARLSSTNTDDIIDNNNSSGQAVVTIAPSDVAFETSGCSDWHLVS